MKILKIILGVLGVLVLIFLATGVITTQTKYATSVVINETANNVFKQFSDQELLKEWMSEIKTITPIKETENIVGSIYEIEVESEGKMIKMTEEVLEHTHNKSMTLYFISDFMLKTDAFTFVEKDGKTTITKNTIIESDSYLMRCVFPWMKSALKGFDQQPMDKFKMFIEKE